MMAPPRPATMRLQKLLAGYPVTTLGAAGHWHEQRVTGISCDSRAVRAGDVFFAVRGERQHGAVHLDEALRNGAAVVVTDPHAAVPHSSVPVLVIPELRSRLSEIGVRWHGDPSAAIDVVAVTGTNGKTTVCHLLADLWSDRRSGYIGTLGAGTIDALHPTGLTTPDAFEIQRLLAEFRDRGIGRVALEASSHALAQGRLNAVTTRCAVFTNLTRDHLDYHGVMDSYLAAKARVFDLPGVRYGVFNLDDPAAAELYRANFDRIECWSFGVTNGADQRAVAHDLRHVQVSIHDAHDGGMDLSIRTPVLAERVRVPLVGRHNASNLAAVVAISLALGVQWNRLSGRLVALRQVPGRLQRIGVARPAIYVDYAHTPDALEQALATLRQVSQGQLWCVFGCGGDRDTGKRPMMGAVAARLADQVVITSDNPRHESPDAIAAEVARGAAPDANPIIELDRRAAIACALDLARPDDVILVAGKGHETTQQLADRTIAFNDADVIRELIAERGA